MFFVHSAKDSDRLRVKRCQCDMVSIDTVCEYVNDTKWLIMN